MIFIARPIYAACALAFAAIVSAGVNAEEPPAFWAVTGVASNDVLNMRDVPSADSKSVGQIPPNARGLKHLGCRRNQPPLEQWARMNQAARREALTQWCRVEYHGQQGWVAGRFLKPDGGAAN